MSNPCHTPTRIRDNYTAEDAIRIYGTPEEAARHLHAQLETVSGAMDKDTLEGSTTILANLPNPGTTPPPRSW
jgi:hypothetical protein